MGWGRFFFFFLGVWVEFRLGWFGVVDQAIINDKWV